MSKHDQMIYVTLVAGSMLGQYNWRSGFALIFGGAATALSLEYFGMITP